MILKEGQVEIQDESPDTIRRTQINQLAALPVDDSSGTV